MSDAENTVPEVPDAPDLAGIPGLGSIRRRTLAAAGVTTPIELARLTVGELVSLTGMPRTQAEKMLSTLAPPPNDSPETPDATEDTPPDHAGQEDDAPATLDAPPPGSLDAAAFRVRSLISDLSRVASPRLEKPLVKIVLVLDDLPLYSDRLTPKRRRRLEKTLDALIDRLERAATQNEKRGGWSDKREKRLREHLRENRRNLTELLRVPSRRKQRLKKDTGK